MADDATMRAVEQDMSRVMAGDRGAAQRYLTKDQMRTIMPVLRSYDPAFRWAGGASAVPFVRADDFQQMTPNLSAQQRIVLSNLLRARGASLDLGDPKRTTSIRTVSLPADTPTSVAMHELAHTGRRTIPTTLADILRDRAFSETGSMVAENNYSGLSSRMGPAWQYRYMRQYGPKYTGNFNTDAQETLRFSDRWHDPNSTLYKMGQQWLRSNKPLREYDTERRLTGPAPVSAGSPMSKEQFEQQFPAMKTLRMTIQKSLPKKSESLTATRTELFLRMLGRAS